MKELSIANDVSSLIDFDRLIGKEIEITGMVQNVRALAWGGFVIVRTPNYLLQTVAEKTKVDFDLNDLPVESTVRIKGTVQEAKINDKAVSPRNCEIKISRIEVIARPSVSPLPLDTTKKELVADLSTKLDLRPLTLRPPKQRAVFRIASVIASEFGNFLQSVGFTRIHSPKIVFSGAEGGANIFQIDYFKRKAFLAQSPQFYKQMMVGVFGRVFEVGPVFRAEKHDTSRHLNEYVSLDFEMMLRDGFEELMRMEALLLRHILDMIGQRCRPEIEILELELPRLDKIVALTFPEVKEIAFAEYGKDFRKEKDLDPEEERLICAHAKKTWNADFVFVTHYPAEKRPFYTMADPQAPELTLSFDLLLNGVEITTGGQRLHRYEDYLKKFASLGMDGKMFESYLQTFKYGMPPHGGLGIGLERLTAQICKIANIKEASLFPRDINRLEP